MLFLGGLIVAVAAFNIISTLVMVWQPLRAGICLAMTSAHPADTRC